MLRFPAPSLSASTNATLTESVLTACSNTDSRLQLKFPVRQPPSQLQQKMLQPPCAQHGVAPVPSEQRLLHFSLQHTARTEGSRLVTTPKKTMSFMATSLVIGKSRKLYKMFNPFT